MWWKLSEIKVHIPFPGFPIGGISGTWRPDRHERDAAWEMYVELITRVTVVELKPDEGLLREALSSYYSLFETTRRILREHGPVVARPKGRQSDRLSFGEIAVAILNDVVRPLLAKWHPLLLHYEAQRVPAESPMQHEREWPLAAELRVEISSVRKILVMYADVLAKIADVPPLARRSPSTVASGM